MYENNPNNYNDVNGNVTPVAPSDGGPKGLVIGVVACAICAVVGLGLGIFNSVQTARLSQMMSEVYGDEELDTDAEEEITCVLPGNASEIDYLMIGYNNGDNQVFVDSENEVTFYTSGANASGNSSSTEQVVETDVAAIMQQAFSEGLNEYSGYRDDAYDENDDLVWDYMVELGTKDGHICQAGGEGATPAWFNTLVELVNSKK